MNQNELRHRTSANPMEVENADEYSIQVVVPQPFNEIPVAYEAVHPLALIAIDVDPSEAQEQASDESPPESAASSRAESPAKFAEDSNEEPPKKRSHSDEDEGALCPICFDNWTTTGDHRVCVLRCGHLFGYKCVTRWLNNQRKKTCPTCNQIVGRHEPRFVYAKKLIAMDTSELDKLKRQLEVVIEERNKARGELAKYACREHQLQQEIAHLRTQLQQQAAMPKQHQSQEKVVLYMDKSVEICKFGASRVFDAKSDLNLLMASMKSPTSLFAGFGLKKISISDYRTIAFIPVHSLQIRDICFHKDENWVLTASMDKTFKVTDNNLNRTIHQVPHQMPLWSCCWDMNNSFMLYVGTQSGSVINYDVRNLAEPVATLDIEGDMSPVVSVASIPAGPGEVLPQGGVISCKLNSLWLFEHTNGDYSRHSISLEGPFVSMKYQPSSKQLLVSSRPNSRVTYSRHTLSTLERKDQNSIDCNIVHSFQGGGMQKLLSKSCFLSNSKDYVAAHQENSKSVYLWSINTGEKVCSVAAHESVLDLKGLNTKHGTFLVSLTDKKLDFFKFV